MDDGLGIGIGTLNVVHSDLEGLVAQYVLFLFFGFTPFNFQVT